MFLVLVAVALTLASLATIPAGMAAADLTVASLAISSVVEPAHPQIGDRVSIAFDVEALGSAGLPAYQLIGAEDLFAGEFRPEPHGSTFPDRVVFELTALRPGVAEIQLHVDYEAEHCDGEHCYWAFRGQLSPVVRIEVGTGEPGEELPDLVATRVAPQVDIPYCPLEGIYFCVENRGSVAASGFQILLHVVGGESAVRFLLELAPAQEACLGVPSFDEGIDFVPNRPGEQLEVVVDAMHEVAESDEGNNRTVFDVPLQPVPPGGCPTPTPTPSGGLRISSTGFGFPCNGSLDVIISATGPPSEGVTVDELALWHGYSQGDYGTAFDWDLSGITLPTVLASGAHLSIPVTYPAGGAFNSRLHVRVHGTAGNGSGVEAMAVFRGANCGTPISTATPTPTPTPLPTGDLGEVEVNGIALALGPGDGLSGALVTFRVALQGPSYGQTVTDADGRFSFRIPLHDTDRLEIRIDAPGYLTNHTYLRATDIVGIVEFPMIPIAPEGPLSEVDSPLCAVDCDGDLRVGIDELVGGVAIAVGNTSLDRCVAADTNEDQRVSVAEIMTGVNNALAGCRPIASEAVGRLDQLWGGSTGGICGLEQEALHIGADGPLAQEFVPTAPQLSGVAILLHRGSTVRGAGVDVAIRAGSIDGPVIGTASTRAQIYFEDWVQFDFDPPLALTPGATYLIVPGTESPYFLWVGLQGIGPNCESTGYAGGDAFVEGARDPDTDFVFATFAGD